MPARRVLWEKKANALRALGRYEQAQKVLNQWLEEYGQNDFVTMIMRREKARIYLETGEPGQALNILEHDRDSYQGGVMLILAKAHEALEQYSQAEDMFAKAKDRYSQSVDYSVEYAAFLLRHDRYLDAAKELKRGRMYAGAMGAMPVDMIYESLSSKSREDIAKAVGCLINEGAPYRETVTLAYAFSHHKAYGTAMDILADTKVSKQMLALEKDTQAYKIMNEWQGPDKAEMILKPHLEPTLNGPFSMVLFQEGLFDLIVNHVKDPDVYPPRFKEFMWVMKLMAWMGCDREPAELNQVFTEHYADSSSDQYHTIGRFLIGYITEHELLKIIRTQKQRCEIPYYIGFKYRMDKQFDKAADWYQICCETGLTNNGEYHWASTELFWWAHMGTKRRNKNVSDDIGYYRNH